MSLRETSISRREDARFGDRGSAVVLALAVMMLLAAAGSALVLIAVTDTRIGAFVSAGADAFYGADAALERALVDLAALDRWDDALSGAAVSTLIDGPGHVRMWAGERIDLDEATNMLRCGRRAACRDADVAVATVDRPWGVNNPRWQLFAWGPLEAVIGAGDVRYVAVWVADDPAETDGDPWRDGDTLDNPGRAMLALVAHAYGPGGARRVVEATIRRSEARDGAPARVCVVAWREVR